MRYTTHPQPLALNYSQTFDAWLIPTQNWPITLYWLRSNRFKEPRFPYASLNKSLKFFKYQSRKTITEEDKNGTGAVSRNRSSFRCVYQKIYLDIPSAPPLRLPGLDVLAFNLSITLKMPETAAQPLLLGFSHHWQATHFRYVNDL